LSTHYQYEITKLGGGLGLGLGFSLDLDLALAWTECRVGVGQILDLLFCILSSLYKTLFKRQDKWHIQMPQNEVLHSLEEVWGQGRAVSGLFPCPFPAASHCCQGYNDPNFLGKKKKVVQKRILNQFYFIYFFEK